MGLPCHIRFTYQYAEQELLLVEEVSGDFSYFTEEAEQMKEFLPFLPEETVEFWHIVKKKYNMAANEMEMAEDTYGIVIEDKTYDYSADSQAGRKVRKMRNWIESE